MHRQHSALTCNLQVNGHVCVQRVTHPGAPGLAVSVGRRREDARLPGPGFHLHAEDLVVGRRVGHVRRVDTALVAHEAVT